jgi:hypothetical protein
MDDDSNHSMFIRKGFPKCFYIAQIRHLAEASAIAWRRLSIHNGFRGQLTENSAMANPLPVHFFGGIIFQSNKILLSFFYSALFPIPLYSGNKE